VSRGTRSARRDRPAALATSMVMVYLVASSDIVVAPLELPCRLVLVIKLPCRLLVLVIELPCR
jgi:hypothetical protein